MYSLVFTSTRIQMKCKKKMCEMATYKEAKQIIVTDSPISPLASLSDVCLTVKEAQIKTFRSQTSTMCLLQAISVAFAFRKKH